MEAALAPELRHAEQRERLRIAMVAACPFPANHGSAASIREMSEGLARLGHEVHVVTYPLHQDIPLAGVKVHRIRVPLLKPGAIRIGPAAHKPIYDLLLVFKLLQVLARHDIDIIHAHNYEAAMIGWFGKLLGPRKLAALLGRFLDVLVPRAADTVTAVSDELREYLIGAGLARQKVYVVPAGVNLEMFSSADGADVRRRHGLGDAPVVIYTGAFEQFQRIDYLLLAMQGVLREMPQARLLVVGNVPNPANLARYQELAARLAITQSVLFLDGVPLEQVPAYLACSDVAVVPRTDCPGHPVKLLNYMGASKPIVSFRGGAKGLHHMYNGYLAADHDYQDLARGICHLLKRRDVAALLGANARATIGGTFDWDTLVRGIEILYRELRTPGARSASRANPYLKNSYVLRYYDRRQQHGSARDERRGPDRRH